MPELINTGIANLGAVMRGADVTLKLSFSFGSGSFLDGGKKGLLVVYDFSQYRRHQETLGDQGEKGTDFFTGKKKTFDKPPPHEVKQGTGILLMATCTFVKRPGGGFDTIIERLESPSVIGSPAFRLKISCLNSVDENGNTRSPKVIDRGILVVTGPDPKDFDEFTARGPDSRGITLRVLSVDRTRVLVSQLNPEHNPMLQPVRIVYDGGAPLPKHHEPAPDPEQAPAAQPPTRLANFTGEYIELINPTDPRDASLIPAPAVLRVHHIGRAVCGWYSPVPLRILSARTPSTPEKVGERIFPADIVDKMFSDKRGIFLLVVEPTPLGSRIGADWILSDKKLDPDAFSDIPGAGVQPLLDSNDKRFFSQIFFEPVDRPDDQPPERIRLHFPQDPNSPVPARGDVVFRRASATSRLSWATVEEILSKGLVPPGVRADVENQLIANFAEALPPAVQGRILSFIISPELEQMVINVGKEKADNPQGISARLAAEELLNKALESLAETLKSISERGLNEPLSPRLVAEARDLARGHVIRFGDAESTMLAALEKIVNDMLEREFAKNPAHKPGTRPKDFKGIIESLSKLGAFVGFAAFNIWPKRGIIYRFEFSKVEQKGASFIVLSGTLGSFKVKISKLDEKTLSSFDPEFPPTEFNGTFMAGAVGAGIQFEVTIDPKNKGKPGVKPPKLAPGATIGPISSDVLSFSDIERRDFNEAEFYIFGSSVQSSGEVGGSASAQALDAVFSLTTRGVVPVTLEIELEKAIKTTKAPNAKDIQKKVQDAVKAARAKKPIPIASGKAAVTLASLLQGHLQRRFHKPIPRPDDKTPIKPVDVKVDFRIRDIQFAKQSAVVTAKAQSLIELRLAVQRKLLEYPGYMEIEGTASPEWAALGRADAARANLDLSQQRADAVLDVVFAAAGRKGEDAIPDEKDIQSRGKGSRPFDRFFSDTPREGFHLSPFSPLPADPKERTEVLADREIFLPLLRRVDIELNGVFTIRIPAE
jgi:outer membrane protein OmpA-like peptidoglycan-associated protein